MANQERGEIGVMVAERLDENREPTGPQRPYVLRPTFDAVCNLEEASDKSIDRILQSVKEGRQSGIRAVVFCLLQDAHGHEIRTLSDASRWIERAGGGDKVLSLIHQVLGINDDALKSVGGAEPANPPEAQATVDGTGDACSSVPVASA